MFHPFGRVMCTTACLHLAVAFLSSHITNNMLDQQLRRRVVQIMQFSSRCHGSRGILSVHEALQKVDMSRLGLETKEIICLMNGTDFKEEGFIHGLEHLAACLSDENAAAVVTSNSHSVCVMHTKADKNFMFFDPLPSHLITNIEMSETMENLVKQALSLTEKTTRNRHQVDVTLINFIHAQRDQPTLQKQD